MLLIIIDQGRVNTNLITQPWWFWGKSRNRMTKVKVGRKFSLIGGNGVKLPIENREKRDDRKIRYTKSDRFVKQFDMFYTLLVVVRTLVDSDGEYGGLSPPKLLKVTTKGSS